ncbi:GntR family transcriptional regulator, partial [Pseudomonas sp. EA_65y_Pfl1_P113]
MQKAAEAGSGPHYLALRDRLVEEIACGALGAGARLPSERRLQLGSGAARGTVREALFQLEAEGL